MQLINSIGELPAIYKKLCEIYQSGEQYVHDRFRTSMDVVGLLNRPLWMGDRVCGSLFFL